MLCKNFQSREELICVFWNTDDEVWDTNGCSLLERNSISTICECNHLTNFGLLFAGKRTEGDEETSVLSNVLSTISIVFLFLIQIIIHFNIGQ